MTTNSAVTTRIADFAARTRLPELREDVVASARDLVTTCLTAGFSAAATPDARTLHNFLAAFDESPAPPGAEGAVPGPLGRLSPAAAVTFNAACMVLGGAAEAPGPSSALLPGPEVVSAALAAAEMEPATGRPLLEGVAVGAETGLRVARAIARYRTSSGWSVRGLAGRIAAAVAVVKILGGGADEFRQAVGLGATQAAGLAYLAPSPGAALLAGRAARDGLESGLLSLTGWKGPERPIEGDRGLFRLLTGSDDGTGADEIVTGIGDEWLLATLAMDSTATERAHRLFGDGKPVEDDLFLRCLGRIESATAYLISTEGQSHEKTTGGVSRRNRPRRSSHSADGEL
jgi:2-methylcitrate dehydratase PrpD